MMAKPHLSQSHYALSPSSTLIVPSSPSRHIISPRQPTHQFPKAKSMLLLPRSPLSLSPNPSEGLIAAKSESRLGQRSRMYPAQLVREMKELEDLGYCSDELPPSSFGSVKNSSGNRVRSFNMTDLWGERMTRQVIKQSGYLQAYRALKSQRRGLKSSGSNPPGTPSNMDEFASRRLIYQNSQRTSVLPKKPNSTIKIKVTMCEPTVPDFKINHKVKRLILDCEDLQQSSSHLQAILPPPNRSKAKPKLLSASERLLFDRIIKDL